MRPIELLDLTTGRSINCGRLHVHSGYRRCDSGVCRNAKSGFFLRNSGILDTTIQKDAKCRGAKAATNMRDDRDKIYPCLPCPRPSGDAQFFSFNQTLLQVSTNGLCLSSASALRLEILFSSSLRTISLTSLHYSLLFSSIILFSSPLSSS